MHTNPHPARIAPRFLASNALSLLGNSIAAVALPLILLATTGDALAAGTLTLICAVPQVMFGVLGGAVLDRFNRRDVSIASDIISALSVALLPVVAGVSYEVLKGLAHSESRLAHALRWPGMQMQRLTTRKPDKGMLEVAIVSMNVALHGMPEKAPRTPEGYAVLHSYRESEPGYAWPQESEQA